MILTQALVPYEINARPWKDTGFRDSYAWHQRLWEAFPGQPDADRNFLYRLDDTGEGIRVLLLSPEPPTRPDWCPSDHWASKTIAREFFNHPRYRFSLVANPTLKLVVRDESGQRKKNGRRVPLLHREERQINGKTIPGQLNWLMNKGHQHGFRLPQPEQLRINPRPPQPFLKQGRAGKHHAVEFDGILEVTDPANFREASTKGIGPAKAFGFGLLCLSPLP